MSRRNPTPDSFIEEYSTGPGEFDSLMWISELHSTEECKAAYRPSRQHRAMSLLVNYHEGRATFTFNQGMYYYRDGYWWPCDRDAAIASQIKGWVNYADGAIEFFEESLRRIGMAGYMRAREAIEMMLARIGELNR